MSKLALKLSELRKDRNLSVKELAQAFNVTERCIQRWETGQRVPDVEIIIALARYFDVTVGYILGVEE